LIINKINSINIDNDDKSLSIALKKTRRPLNTKQLAEVEYNKGYAYYRKPYGNKYKEPYIRGDKSKVK